MRRKPYFRSDSAKGERGSPPLMNLLRNLKPAWWFSAHMHTRFEAEVLHEPAPSSVPATAPNPDEIIVDDDVDEVDTPAALERSMGNTNPDEIALDDEQL